MNDYPGNIWKGNGNDSHDLHFAVHLDVIVKTPGNFRSEKITYFFIHWILIRVTKLCRFERKCRRRANDIILHYENQAQERTSRFMRNACDTGVCMMRRRCPPEQLGKRSPSSSSSKESEKEQATCRGHRDVQDNPGVAIPFRWEPLYCNVFGN